MKLHFYQQWILQPCQPRRPLQRLATRQLDWWVLSEGVHICLQNELPCLLCDASPSGVFRTAVHARLAIGQYTD